MTARSALITGGSSGIGLAIAEMLVADGWHVTLLGRNADKLGVAAASLGDAYTISANLAKDIATEVVAEHLSVHGGLDLLVNSAGIGLVGPIESKTAKALDLEISLNLRSAYRLLQESLPALRTSASQRGSSHVVNVSSLTATETPPNVSMYAATKAALIALSRSAHAELSPEGIHVTALVPGFVDTPGTSWAPSDARDAMIDAADLAEAVRFLLRTSGRCFVPEMHLASAGAGLHEFIDWRHLA